MGSNSGMDLTKEENLLLLMFMYQSLQIQKNQTRDQLITYISPVRWVFFATYLDVTLGNPLFAIRV